MIGRQEKLDEVFNTEKKLPASLVVEIELLTIMKKQKMPMNCFPIIVKWTKQYPNPNPKERGLTFQITTHEQGRLL